MKPMTPRGIYRDRLAEGVQHLILVDYGPHRMYVLEMIYREMGYQPHTERLPWLNKPISEPPKRERMA